MKRVDHTETPVKPKRTRTVSRRPRATRVAGLRYQETILIPVSSHGAPFPIWDVAGIIMRGFIYMIMITAIMMHFVPGIITNNPFGIIGILVSQGFFWFVLMPISKRLKRHKQEKLSTRTGFSLVIGSAGGNYTHHLVPPPGMSTRRLTAVIPSSPPPPRPRQILRWMETESLQS